MALAFGLGLSLVKGFSGVASSPPGFGTPVLTWQSAGDDGVALTSSDVSGATSYTFQRDTDSAFPSPTTLQTGLTRTYTDSGLVKGVTYYYRVSATDGVAVTTSTTQAFTVPLGDLLLESGGVPTNDAFLTGGINYSYGDESGVYALTGTWEGKPYYVRRLGVSDHYRYMEYDPDPPGVIEPRWIIAVVLGGESLAGSAAAGNEDYPWEADWAGTKDVFQGDGTDGLILLEEDADENIQMET